MAKSDLETDMRWILTALGDQLLSVDRKNVSQFIEYGEWALAMETLCEQMCERNVVPSKMVYEKIMNVAAMLRVDDQYRRVVPLPAQDDSNT